MKYTSVKPLTSRIFQGVPEIVGLSPDGMMLLMWVRSDASDCLRFLYDKMPSSILARALYLIGLRFKFLSVPVGMFVASSGSDVIVAELSGTEL
jgi:hypothetical protein